MFYFTEFLGDEKSILYQFFIGAHKLLLGNYLHIPIADKLPISVNGFHFAKIIQDILAPFYFFLNTSYTSEIIDIDDIHFPKQINIESVARTEIKNIFSEETKYKFHINEEGLKQFIIQQSSTQIVIKIDSIYT